MRASRAGLLLALLLSLPLLHANAEPARKARPALARDRATSSSIVIRFADRSMPEIRVSGRTSARPYGVYATEPERRARDRVAATLPPPDPSLYELDWETHDYFDAARVSRDQDTINLYGDYYGSGLLTPLERSVRRNGVGEALRPTPADRHPRYNLTEYQAALGEWQRAQERAARSEADGVQVPPARSAKQEPPERARSY